MNTQYVSNPEETKELYPRYKLFYIAIAIAMTLFVSRLWYLQIIKGSELHDFSEKNRIKQNKINAPRGLILDRNGKTLVENLLGYEAVISPQYMEDLSEISKRISPIINVEPQRIITKVEKSRKQNGRFYPVRVKENLTREEVFRLKRIRLETPGLEIRESIIRSYPLKDNGAQIFGYVGEINKEKISRYNEKYKKNNITFKQGDIVGQNGLEEKLEPLIRGEDGVSLIQVDVRGREVYSQAKHTYSQEIQNQDPVSGNNIVLTLDRDVQEAAYKSFQQLQRIGAIVALKNTGEVLAWVSTPSFDPNEFSTGISTQIWSKLLNDPFKPLRNKVIQDVFSPGSTFKPLVALAALQEKEITDKTIVNCPGVLMMGRRPFHDHLRGGFGNITLYEALERSSNIFFYKMGIALGVDRMYKYISLLGLGQKTNIDVPREDAGLMPNSEWKKKVYGEEWQPGENLSVAIGQGYVEATPLQMAVAYSTIGLEGKMYKPYVVKKIIDKNGKTITENNPVLVRDISQPQANGAFISPENFKIVKEGMRRVANGERGTAHWWKVPGIQMAGKTGTSQVMGFSADQIYKDCMSRPIHQRHHGWFVAFAPHDKPEITVAVLAEHSCHGNTGAAPVVRDVVLAYMKKHHPDLVKEAVTVVPVTKVEETEE